MSIAKKLQIKPGQTVRILNAPKDFSIDAVVAAGKSADAVVLFARNRAELEKRVAPALAAALEDRTSWIAYPKAGQLDTDLNRDILRELMETKGVTAVRQVAIDDVWSALRFRPA